MKKIFAKNRFKIKIILILGVILLGFFGVPRVADALAVKSASYAREQIEQIIKTSPNARLLAQDACPPGEEWDTKLATCVAEGTATKTGAKAGAATPAKPGTNPLNTDTTMQILGFLSLILEVIARIIWPIAFLSGALMENDIIFGGAMGIKLHDMWIQIRNIVNILFVVVLVGVALYNITGFASEKFQLKQILPKIILGLILVNFSYMISTVMLDVIGVGTNAMFGLPISLGVTPAVTDTVQKQICQSIGYKVYQNKSTEKLAETIAKGTKEMLKEKDICDAEGKPTPKLEAFIASWKPHSASIVMAVELMKLQDLQQVALGKQLTIESLTINVIFSIAMFLIYGVSFIVLFVVLLGRAIIVWLAVVLSPLLMITYLAPEISGGKELKEIGDKVIATALAPMIIGFVLSVGYILMKTFQGTAEFMAGSSASQALGLGMMSFKTNVSGITNFQELMIAIATAGFVWAGVKAASSKAITGKATEGIMGMAQKAGTWLAKAPLYYSNIFPTGTGKEGEKGVSAGTMLKTLTGIPAAMDEKVQTGATKMLETLGIREPSGAGGGRETTSTNVATDQLNSPLTNEGIQKVMVKNIDNLARQTDNRFAATLEKKMQQNSMTSGNYADVYRKAKAAKDNTDPTKRQELNKDLKESMDKFSRTTEGLTILKKSGGATAETTTAVPEQIRAKAKDASGAIKSLYSGTLTPNEIREVYATDPKTVLSDNTTAKINALSYIETLQPQKEENITTKEIKEAVEGMKKALEDSSMLPAEVDKFIKDNLSKTKARKELIDNALPTKTPEPK